MKRTVFLLGAGAAIDWKNAPSTWSLTNELKNNGPKNSDGQYITKYIVDYFKKQTSQEINFEGLIDIIEQCAQYWLSKGADNSINSIVIREDNEFWKNSINYDSIKNANPTAVVNSIKNSELRPEAQFFIYLLSLIYDGINTKISNYGSATVNTKNTNKIDCEENNSINALAETYFTNLSKDNYLRIYTLNYDRVIQYLFQKGGLNAFQGFDSEDLLPKLPNQMFFVDSKRILTSFDENCIYHLHGNYAWQIIKNDFDSLPNEIVNGYFGYMGANRAFSFVEAEKNKPLFQSNIITGYSKVQRTNLIPFKQMAFAFDNDCHNADEIIIIGYSFADQHINETIRQAKAINPTCKITCIDKDSNIKNKILENVLWNNRQFQDNDFAKHSSVLTVSENFNSYIFNQSWKDYLKVL